MLKLKNVIKVQELKGIEAGGTLTYYDTQDSEEHSYWCIEYGAGSRINIEQYFEKFRGKHVRLTIDTFEQDELHLLGGDSAT